MPGGAVAHGLDPISQAAGSSDYAPAVTCVALDLGCLDTLGSEVGSMADRVS